nr:MAG TPA: hypothetical protein [Caudoviricetes sp.]
MALPISSIVKNTLSSSLVNGSPPVYSSPRVLHLNFSRLAAAFISSAITHTVCSVTCAALSSSNSLLISSNLPPAFSARAVCASTVYTIGKSLSNALMYMSHLLLCDIQERFHCCFSFRLCIHACCTKILPVLTLCIIPQHCCRQLLSLPVDILLLSGHLLRGKAVANLWQNKRPILGFSLHHGSANTAKSQIRRLHPCPIRLECHLLGSHFYILRLRESEGQCCRCWFQSVNGCSNAPTGKLRCFCLSYHIVCVKIIIICRIDIQFQVDAAPQLHTSRIGYCCTHIGILRDIRLGKSCCYHILISLQCVNFIVYNCLRSFLSAFSGFICCRPNKRMLIPDTGTAFDGSGYHHIRLTFRILFGFDIVIPVKSQLHMIISVFLQHLGDAESLLQTFLFFYRKRCLFSF